MDKRNFKIYRYFKEKRFAEDFLCGKLRLMPFKYYRDIEDEVRSDKFDGKSVFESKQKEKILISGNEVITEGVEIETFSRDDKYFVIGCFSYSHSIAKFGGYRVSIDKNNFIDRVTGYCGERLPYVIGDVLYYDVKDFNKRIPMLCKRRNGFSDEEELRICLNMKKEMQENKIKKLEDVFINIGSLRDIAILDIL